MEKLTSKIGLIADLGPVSPKYAKISRISDKAGLSLIWSVHPARLRRGTEVEPG